MVVGVNKGFTKELEIIGVGYKADVKGKVLVLNLGYSHLIEFPFPDGITIEAKTGPQSTLVTIHGRDKEQVNQTAAGFAVSDLLIATKEKCTLQG